MDTVNNPKTMYSQTHDEILKLVNDYIKNKTYVEIYESSGRTFVISGIIQKVVEVEEEVYYDSEARLNKLVIFTILNEANSLMPISENNIANAMVMLLDKVKENMQKEMPNIATQSIVVFSATLEEIMFVEKIFVDNSNN